MSSTSLTIVLNELFSAPLDAAVEAEKKYREIWARWLTAKVALLKSLAADDATFAAEEYKDILDTAPIISINGTIDTGITMRISGVRESEISGGGGLQVGPIYGGVSFGSSSRTAEESVFRASASFTLSNGDYSLKDYLQKNKILPVDAKVDGKQLEKVLESLSAS